MLTAPAEVREEERTDKQRSLFAVTAVSSESNIVVNVVNVAPVL
jgi:hypothetical protein